MRFCGRRWRQRRRARWRRVSPASSRILAAGAPARKPVEPDWTTRNTVALELQSVRLRDLSLDHAGPATLICAPFALHGATIADFAKGHSLVEALRGAGCQRLLVTDWRSATPEMRYLSIDSYLADSST